MNNRRPALTLEAALSILKSRKVVSETDHPPRIVAKVNAVTFYDPADDPNNSRPNQRPAHIVSLNLMTDVQEKELLSRVKRAMNNDEEFIDETTGEVDWNLVINGGRNETFNVAGNISLKRDMSITDRLVYNQQPDWLPEPGENVEVDLGMVFAPARGKEVLTATHIKALKASTTGVRASTSFLDLFNEMRQEEKKESKESKQAQQTLAHAGQDD